MKYDVIIIGAGVNGCAVARELSRYQLNVAVLEREEDVCCGTSKANSGIVHAGFDAPVGSRKAELNVEGNQMMQSLARELDFPFQQNGSLVLCLSKSQRPQLEELYQRGVANNVKQLRIVEKDELRELEPHVSQEAVAALYAPTGGIVCPFGLTIALGENACENGVEFYFNRQVTDVEQADGTWRVHTTDRAGRQEIWETACVVNAAGVYADVFHNMVSERRLHITPRRGEYCLLDRNTQGLVKHTVFQLPGKYGKGVLVTPTVHGNTLLGPTAVDVEDKEETATSREGLEELAAKAAQSVQGIPMNQVITSFAGLRAHEDGDDFVLEEAAPGFFDCAGMESPGLTSAPAVGKRLASMVAERLQPEEKKEFKAERKGILNPALLGREERARLIRQQPAYGTIVCRCEMISEGEILDAIRRPLGAKSLDGVKRRTRAGMGRCQSGFCSPKVMELLARECGVSMEEVTKCGGGSRIIQGVNKDRLGEEAYGEL